MSDPYAIVELTKGQQMTKFQELVESLQSDVVTELESVFFDLAPFASTRDGVVCTPINVSVGAYYTLNEQPMYFVNDDGDVFRTRDRDEALFEFVSTLCNYHDHW